MPAISIIIPIYNAENTLKRCLDSIIQQSFNDFEAILINDCSKDKSGEICNQTASIDKRFKVIHLTKNAGVSNARNVGIDIAIGEFIMFCDSDDYVDKDWCKCLYSIVKEQPKNLVVSNLFKSFNNINTVLIPFENNKSITTCNFYQLFKMNLSGYLVNKIYNLNIIKEYNIRFNTRMVACEDVIFNTDYIKHCNSITYISKPLYYYWTNPQSTTNSFQQDALALNLKAFAARYPLIEKQYIGEFCETYFHFFINLLDNIFDKRCTLSFIQKLKYNQRILSTSEFKLCVTQLSTEKNNKLTLRIIKTYNYYLFWLYQKLYNIKLKLVK